MKQIIINGDDFGMTKSINKAIFTAFCDGWITETTMVANGDEFEDGLRYIECDKKFGNHIGIHLNLTAGTPLTDGMYSSRFVENGKFNGFFLKHNMYFTKISRLEKKIIYDELCAQVEKIQSYGIHITHADSHQHIHMALYLFPIINKVLKKYSINKIRIRKNIKNSHVKTIFNNLIRNTLRILNYHTTDYFDNIRLFNGVKDGVTEAMVHPDYFENVLIDRYGYQNQIPTGIELSAQIKSHLGNDFIPISYENI